jgi:2,3-bisphosphoglycerate-dependent phosphoglycerate mutase
MGGRGDLFMRIFLIRHGFSEGNEDLANYKLRGDPHVRLTETGWTQAIRAGQFLKQYLARHPTKGAKPVRILCSTFRRTRETAAGVLHGAQGALDAKNLRVTPRLTEMSFGLFAHFHSEAERAQKMPMEAAFFKQGEQREKFYAKPPLGESPMDVQNRVAPLTGTIMREHDKGFEDHLLVTHGVTLRAYAMDFLGIDPDQYETFKNPENCSIYVIEGERGKPYSLRQIFNGETGQPVHIDWGAKLKGVYLPDVPPHLRLKP